MSERKPDIILEVDGRRYGGWKSIDISRGLEQCAGTFRLSVTDRWPQQNEPRGIKAGAACRVTIDGRAVITGYVDDVEASWSATSHEYRVSGRDKTADLVDCCPPSLQLKGADLPALARKAQIKQEKAYETVAKAVANGDLPNAAISDDYSTLYLDDSLLPSAPQPAAAPQPASAAPLTEAEQFRREGVDFLNYLKACCGRLGSDADEELTQMRKICASILGFVHNHPEQLPRVRRFREYYLPTTRKLLDTAQGLGDTDTANAAEIRRDITGILHTLNQAYAKLYDTLLQDVSMDVSTEIDTLETMLRQDGLTHDFESDFNTRS